MRILQARILEWIAMSFSRASSQPGDQTQVSCIAGRYLNGLVVFLYFLQFTSEFCSKAFMIWATVSSWSCFCWLYRASPSLAAKNIINLIWVLAIWWYPCVDSSLVLLEEALQIAVKRREAKSKWEKERYKHLNAELQRIARRDKKAFLSDQCKEIEESNRMGKTRDLFKKIGDTKGIFHAKMTQ